MTTVGAAAAWYPDLVNESVNEGLHAVAARYLRDRPSRGKGSWPTPVAYPIGLAESLVAAAH